MKFLPNIYILLLLFFTSGCATVRELPSQVSESQLIKVVEKQISKQEVVTEKIKELDVASEVQVIEGEQVEKPAKKNGLIFAKTDFQDILQTSYVKLLFERQGDVPYKFQLHIGDKAKSSLLWDMKVVQPGYFFIELPVGKYKVTSITIPVGSTTASEAIDIDFQVTAEEVVYMGTLRLVGTKEKIKLGGVPVIKPGFEYEAFVLDQRDEGFGAFQQKYPNRTDKIKVNLMKINLN